MPSGNLSMLELGTGKRKRRKNNSNTVIAGRIKARAPRLGDSKEEEILIRRGGVLG